MVRLGLELSARGLQLVVPRVRGGDLLAEALEHVVERSSAIGDVADGGSQADQLGGQLVLVDSRDVELQPQCLDAFLEAPGLR